MTAKNTEEALLVLSNSYHTLDKNVAVMATEMKAFPKWPDVKKEVTKQIKHTKIECELSRKNAVKKMTMREMILVSGMLITALGVLVPVIVKALQ